MSVAIELSVKQTFNGHERPTEVVRWAFLTPSQVSQSMTLALMVILLVRLEQPLAVILFCEKPAKRGPPKAGT